MPRIKNLWDYPFLLLGMILITHYYTFSVVALTGLTFERSCATFWMNDYESKKRPGISIFIFIFLELFSAFIAFTWITLQFNSYYWIVIGMLVLITNFMLFFYIWYWNTKMHRILETMVLKKYTLQARFQAKENARSLNLLKFIVSGVTGCIFVEGLFFVVQWTKAIKSYEVALLFVLEFTNSQNKNGPLPSSFPRLPPLIAGTGCFVFFIRGHCNVKVESLLKDHLGNWEDNKIELPLDRSGNKFTVNNKSKGKWKLVKLSARNSRTERLKKYIFYITKNNLMNGNIMVMYHYESPGEVPQLAT
uniref:Gamma-secretase subunit Aph-1 n=1 Tax=Caenorhabditis tropicalis TaxID=1561998 RepID=A0A1I7UQI5_9PELO